MNKLAVEELVKKVRQRIAEGDCPTTPALTVETLENLGDHLASPVAGGSAEKCENCGHTHREHTLAGRRLIDNCMCCANPSFKLKDKLVPEVAGGSARIAEIASLEAEIERLRHKLLEIPAIDAALLERRNKEVIDLRNALAADAKLVPEGWVKVTPETMPEESL